MLCQDCKKQTASVHLTQIVNNEKIVLSLCKDCAAKRGFHSPLDNVPFPLAEILSGVIKQQFPEKAESIPDLKCSNCGLTFEQFTQQGRFGCGQCYKAFRSRLELIMRKIHGSSLHKGKLPVTSSEHPLPVKEEERLEAELKKAIDAEDFERAADLRDKLKAMRKAHLVARDEE
jgi:protein arginine kinase activator